MATFLGFCKSIRRIRLLYKSHRKIVQRQTEQPSRRQWQLAKEEERLLSSGFSKAQQVCHQGYGRGFDRRDKGIFFHSWRKPQLKK